MSRKYCLMIVVITVLLLSFVKLFPIKAAPPFQTGEGQVYTMQADDTLEKLSEKFFNDPRAWPLILGATNARAKIDGRFTLIENPDRIEIGQNLWVPYLDQASQPESSTSEIFVFPRQVKGASSQLIRG